MKKILVVTALVIGLAAATAFAQMGGMSDKQHEGMMDGQMINQQMMRDMSGMMNQMERWTLPR